MPGLQEWNRHCWAVLPRGVCNAAFTAASTPDNTADAAADAADAECRQPPVVLLHQHTEPFQQVRRSRRRAADA